MILDLLRMIGKAYFSDLMGKFGVWYGNISIYIFQQVGGIEVHQSLELTYGLERLVINKNIENIFDIEWVAITIILFITKIYF